MGNVISDFENAGGKLGSFIENAGDGVSQCFPEIKKELIKSSTTVQFPNGAKRLTDALVEMTKTDLQGLEKTATILSNYYHNSVFSFTQNVSAISKNATELFSETFVQGEQLLSDAFKDASNQTKVAMVQITNAVSSTTERVSDVLALEKIQTFLTLALFFVPLILIVIVFVYKNKGKKRRNVLNFVSAFVCLVSIIVILTEVIAIGTNDWIVNMTQYLFLEFSVFYFLTSLMCLILNGLWLVVKNEIKKKKLKEEQEKETSKKVQNDLVEVEFSPEEKVTKEKGVQEE